MSELVTLTRDGDVGVVTIDNPPVNALSPGVLDGIIAAVRVAACRTTAVKAIVLTGGGRIFCGGADINEFGKLTSGQQAARRRSSTRCSTRWRTAPSRWSAPSTAPRSAAGWRWRWPATTAWPSPARRSASRR